MPGKNRTIETKTNYSMAVQYSKDSADFTEEKLRKLLESYHPVSTHNDENFNEKLCWCLEHCQGKFRDLKMLSHRVWFFQIEQDASMFALKWSD